MATAFKHPPGTDPALVVTDAMIAVDHELTHVPVKTAMQMIEFCRNRLAATEARLLADRYEAGASDRDVEDIARSGGTGTSKKEAKKRASRAKATNANPDIANKMDSGDLSAEQADVIASAAEETDGAAACDKDLIDDIANTSPEQGTKKAKKFVNDRRSNDDIQTKHDRQRRRRGWYPHRLPTGNEAITIHGDCHSVDEMEQGLRAQADHEYELDGGRNVPNRDHPRTRDQRGFDAAHKLMTGRSNSPAPDPTSSTTRKTSKIAPSTRNVIHINVSVDQLTSVDGSVFTTADGKPLPRSVVEEIACGCDIIGHIFSGSGELLWQTRKKRLATPAQINGLIARDGGCVLCNSHHSKCVAHHLMPWEAPGKGETNIDNLALLCGHCHTRVHQRKWTMVYDRESRTMEGPRCATPRNPARQPTQTFKPRHKTASNQTPPRTTKTQARRTASQQTPKPLLRGLSAPNGGLIEVMGSGAHVQVSTGFLWFVLSSWTSSPTYLKQTQQGDLIHV